MSVKLADGTYTNHCNPEEIFTVESGKIHAVLQPGSIAVLYNEGEQKFAAPARVMVAEGTRGYILGESLEVTLESENAAKAAYSVDGGAEVPFVSGDKVVLGEGKADSEMTTLTLTAENAEGNKTCMTYLFKKQGNVSAGTKIYFEKPESWGNTISAYVYDESSYTSVKENGKWPGVKMTKEADGTYSYTFEAEWIAPLVIFNDGTNQSNGALEPGEEIIADKIYSVSRVEK